VRASNETNGPKTGLSRRTDNSHFEPKRWNIAALLAFSQVKAHAGSTPLNFEKLGRLFIKI